VQWHADKRLLLVLDSCESLTGPCAGLVAEMLTAAPGVTVLATSRRPLASHVEEVLPVPPLPADGPDALALFAERVTDRLGRAPLAEPGAAEPAEAICRRLEGIPPAIELATAQVGPAGVHPPRGAPELQPVRTRCEQTSRAALGEEGYAAAYARGASAHGPTAVAALVRDGLGSE
jgi:hypothetical protein